MKAHERVVDEDQNGYKSGAFHADVSEGDARESQEQEQRITTNDS